MSLKLSPSVGVARLGNSTDEYCIGPDKIGGLPFDVGPTGGNPVEIQSFRDRTGLIKRQGQLFKIYDGATEIKLGVDGCTNIIWTVHLASKKAAWRQYSELDGNLMYPDNSYVQRGVDWRNKDYPGNRQELIIDPGPRTIQGPLDSANFDEASVPLDYPHAHYPQYSQPGNEPLYGLPIRTLGEIKTDLDGRLTVLGGFGRAGGDTEIENYGGSDSWYDDISDGPVYCTVQYSDKPDVELSAWIIVGSPDFAPQIVNISNLSDTMLDVAVRHLGLGESLGMRIGGAWNPAYEANYERDIKPIIDRMGRYQWVSNVQPMMTMGSQMVNYADKTQNAALRSQIYSYFRGPNGVPPYNADPYQQPQQVLFSSDTNGTRFPKMPVNSGSNSVSETNIIKFLALNETQYFLMGQWAQGIFNDDAPTELVDSADQASIGNCVGLPMCPGIEVTWSLQNPVIYDGAYIIKDQMGKNGYNDSGLTAERDECEAEDGCQPGDLTKRMACPWQADFFQCTIQNVNFTDPTVNKDADGPVKPTYYSYWWPPQSPWDVLTSGFTPAEQEMAHASAGTQLNYQRGINSFQSMVEYWYSLGFIRDLNDQNPGFPYLMETERLHEVYDYVEIETSTISQREEDTVTIPVWYISKIMPHAGKKALKAPKGERAQKLVSHLEQLNFKPVKLSKKAKPPRRGTLNRR